MIVQLVSIQMLQFFHFRENRHNHLETSEPAVSAVSRSVPESTPGSLSPQPSHSRLRPASNPANTLNGVLLDTGNFQLHALPKPHERVH